MHELERAGVIEIVPKPDGHGSFYEATPKGREFSTVLKSLGDWAQRWTEITSEHSAPDFVLWSWCQTFLKRELLPDRRIVVRFDLRQRHRKVSHWLLIENLEAELCRTDPGFGDDLVVEVTDPLIFARWHLGLVSWARALRSGGIQVTGPSELSRALPKWNAGPEEHARWRSEHDRAQHTPGARSWTDA